MYTFLRLFPRPHNFIIDHDLESRFILVFHIHRLKALDR